MANLTIYRLRPGSSTNGWAYNGYLFTNAYLNKRYLSNSGFSSDGQRGTYDRVGWVDYCSPTSSIPEEIAHSMIEEWAEAKAEMDKAEAEKEARNARIEAEAAAERERIRKLEESGVRNREVVEREYRKTRKLIDDYYNWSITRIAPDGNTAYKLARECQERLRELENELKGLAE